MNVAFVYSLDDAESINKPLRSQEYIQFGISYISSFLKKNHHATKLVVLSKIFGNAYKTLIDQCVKEFSPKLFCFTAVHSEYPFIASVANYVKTAYPDIYLLIGGCHASLNPEEMLQADFDAVCIGEGELPILELVSKLEQGRVLSQIPNLWIKHAKGIEKNPTRSFLKNLDDLPFPDRAMWDEWIQEEEGARISVLLGRGCPFECTYCCNSALKKLAEGTYVRFRSPENILAEIQEIATRYPEKKTIYLEVESFGVNAAWATLLCEKLTAFNQARVDPRSFGVNLRVAAHLDYEKLFAAMQKAHFTFINIGLESGSERVRREILNRNYSNDDIISTVQLARKYGLKVILFNMIGLPGETPQDFQETIRVNRICQPDKHFTGIFTPYPGTKLYSLCKEKGFLKDRVGATMERRKAVYDFPGFSRRQIQKSYFWFDYHVYKGYLPLPKILIKVAVLHLQANPYLNMAFRRLVRLPLLKQLRMKFIR